MVLQLMSPSLEFMERTANISSFVQMLNTRYRRLNKLSKVTGHKPFYILLYIGLENKSYRTLKIMRLCCVLILWCKRCPWFLFTSIKWYIIQAKHFQFVIKLLTDVFCTYPIQSMPTLPVALPPSTPFNTATPTTALFIPIRTCNSWLKSAYGEWGLYWISEIGSHKE